MARIPAVSGPFAQSSRSCLREPLRLLEPLRHAGPTRRCPLFGEARKWPLPRQSVAIDPGCVKTPPLCYDSLVILRGKLMRRFVEQADRGQCPQCRNPRVAGLGSGARSPRPASLTTSRPVLVREMPSRPSPSRTLKVAIPIPAKSPDDLQSKTSCGEKARKPLNHPCVKALFRRGFRLVVYLQNQTVSFT